MADIVITGASRGIGRALALALAARPVGSNHLVLVARDPARLADVARQVESVGTRATGVTGDLATCAGARVLGDTLATMLAPGAWLVHNAGVWPATRELTADGLERSFVVNCIGPLLLQQPLLDRRLLSRVTVVSAGLIALGRYSPERTPTGRDFSWWRTYCTTKLAFAVAERELAGQHPDVDFVVLHPGVVHTDLVARPGLLGWLLGIGNRFLERPEDCGARLRDVLARDRWSPPGAPCWLHEDRERRWPAAAEDARTRRAIRDLLARFAVLHPPAAT